MYLEFFAFREKPFNLTPDPRYVFPGKNHSEAFAHLLYGINNHVGFISLTGEVGAGKTTILRAFLSQLDADRYRTALIFNPKLSPHELLQTINREFGIPSSATNGPLDALNMFLLQQNAEGRTIVLVIDEAQDLEESVLEQIRLISNLETEREKLIQIVLSGQPELAQILEKKEMRQLNQRIMVRYHLQPMGFKDTVHYIHHRLKVAGGRGHVVFSRSALRQIYRYSRGLPRLVNAACDRVLLAAYTRDTATISPRIAAMGIKDVGKNAVFKTQKPLRLVLISTLGILLGFFATGMYFGGKDFAQTKAPQYVEETEEQTDDDPLQNRGEFPRSIDDELGKVSESESALRAFNVLAGIWKVPSVPESGNLNQFDGMEQMELAAQERGLRVYRISGNLGGLLRLDCPAVLELTMPQRGKRFVALVGMEDEHLLVDLPTVGRRSLSFSELERHWSGQAFLLWRDFQDLLTRKSGGARESHVKRLQGLLQESGIYHKPFITGVYDSDTRVAVKEFQGARGIEQDGIAGGQTLMALYGSIDRFEAPRLTRKQK